ncbi:MAG: DUF2100 domain-containing protein [Candidatus Freyarchaeota archaeon]|nr:DUF2100 domain-containing protein [Candidatus Jordarchaeia archaeon]
MPFSLSSDDVRKISSAINALLTVWSIIRASAPRLVLRGREEEEFVEKLLLAQRSLSDLLSIIGFSLRKNELNNVLSGLNPSETLLLVVSPSFMRRLVGAGVPRERVIAIGGPLSAEDAKELSPRLPEEAVRGVEARLQSFWRELERKVRGIRTVLLILEKSGRVDELIAKRASVISEKFGVNVKIAYLSNLEDPCVDALSRFFKGE